MARTARRDVADMTSSSPIPFRTASERTAIDALEVARRAHELFEARGNTHGADLDDWLQAERELRGSREREG